MTCCYECCECRTAATGDPAWRDGTGPLCPACAESRDDERAVDAHAPLRWLDPDGRRARRGVERRERHE